MKESWDEYVKRKRKEFGVSEPVKEFKTFTGRYRCSPSIAPIETPRRTFKPERIERRFNIHKRSTSGTLDRIVVCGLPSKKAAEHIIKYATNNKGQPIFRTQLYHDKIKECDARVFYEPVPEDATPKEKSMYFNSAKITIEPISGYPRL